MRREHLGPLRGWDEPVARQRRTVDIRSFELLSLLPTLEIDSSGKRCEHHELRERDVGPLSKFLSSIKRIRSIGGQAEPRTWTPCSRKVWSR